MEQENLEQRIRNIEERNEKVEADKAWEVSLVRKISIAVMTYGIAVFVLWVIGSDNALYNALIPALGYILSTQSLPFFKNLWLRTRRKRS